MSPPTLATPRPTQPKSQPDTTFSTLSPILKRRWPIALLTFGAVFGVTAAYVFTRTPIYQANGRILIQRTNTANQLAGLENLADVTTSSLSNNPLNTQMELFTARPVLEQTLRGLEPNLVENPESPLSLEGLRGSIQVAPVPRSDLLEVSYRDPIKERAVEIVNNLMENYRSFTLDISRAQKVAARDFIQSQLPKSQTEFQASLQKLSDFRDRYGILNAEAQISQVISDMGSLRQRINDVQIQLTGLRQTQASLQKLIGNTGGLDVEEIATLSQSKGVQEAITAVQTTQAELNTLKARYTPNHPSVQALERKLGQQQQTLNQRIAETTGNKQINPGQSMAVLQLGEIKTSLINQKLTNAVQIESLSKQLGDLEAALRQREQVAKTLPELQQNLVRLQVEMETSKSRYESLLTALQTAELAENQEIGSSVIIETATASDLPVSPNIPRTLLLGGVLGILLGLGVAWVVDTLDPRISTVDDLRQVFGFTTSLGVIPIFKDHVPQHQDIDRFDYLESLVVRNHPRSPAAEAMRMVASNIKFSNLDNPLRAITVTSFVPNEGKSTTIANLALTIAELGFKVVIIDADLRKPTQHLIWQLPNRQGLSDALVGEVSITDSFQMVDPNISVITGGTLPPNPDMLLSSDKFLGLVNRLKKVFDYVLIDAPPLIVAADASSLSKVADGTLLVARPGVLTRTAFTRVSQSVVLNDLKLVGAVYNGVRQSKSHDSYYYYYYGDGSRNGTKVPDSFPGLGQGKKLIETIFKPR